MPTYRIDVEYLGTRYHGWQEQKNARSVAGELRRAAEAAGAQVIELAGAGRTDAGVHALRQTAHLRLRGEVEVGRFREALNDGLPHDVHVLWLARATDAFHARHSAIARSYLYQISRRRAGLAKRSIWWVREALDERKMAVAAAAVVGRHDFKLFCERPAEQQSTIVVVEQALVESHGSLILVRLAASHFLWKMVRRVVGTLVQVGMGHLTVEQFAQLVEGRPLGREDADPARWTAPGSGLFLERVIYPGEPPLGPVAPASPVDAATLVGGRTFLGEQVASAPPTPPRGPRPRPPVAPARRTNTPSFRRSTGRAPARPKGRG
jgi:tRNA pseudouridine38-40 synthase